MQAFLCTVVLIIITSLLSQADIMPKIPSHKQVKADNQQSSWFIQRCLCRFKHSCLYPNNAFSSVAFSRNPTLTLVIAFDDNITNILFLLILVPLYLTFPRIPNNYFSTCPLAQKQTLTLSLHGLNHCLSLENDWVPIIIGVCSEIVQNVGKHIIFFHGLLEMLRKVERSHSRSLKTVWKKPIFVTLSTIILS